MSSMQSVSALSILFMCVTLLICFGMPVGLAVWAKVKYKKAFSLIPLLAGAIAFFVSQVIIRIPLMQYIFPTFDWYVAFTKMKWPFLITACFTAGLFEEPARFIAFAIMRKRRQYLDGLSYGIGHGGIEAILLVGFLYINNLVFSLMINNGTVGSLGGVSQETIAMMSSTPSYMFLVGGLERIFAVFIHIALSLFLLKGFRVGKKWLYLVAAILLHGLANVDAVVAQQFGTLAAEGSVLIVGTLSLLYIIKQAREWRKSITQPQEVAYEQQGQIHTP